MTSYLEHLPPVLLDSIVLGWLVAMVTLSWHSGRPPEHTGMVEKGGVSPLVLFKGMTGHRQEVAHRELRVWCCGTMRGGRSQMRSCQNLLIGIQLRRAAALTLHSLQISTCVLEFLFKHPLPAASQTPPEGCVPIRGHTEDSFPSTLFAQCKLEATPPLSSNLTTSTV